MQLAHLAFTIDHVSLQKAIGLIALVPSAWDSRPSSGVIGARMLPSRDLAIEGPHGCEPLSRKSDAVRTSVLRSSQWRSSLLT